MITIQEAKTIMDKNFIGSEELKKIGFKPNASVPRIKYTARLLKKIKNDYILILGIPITINQMRDTFGINPEQFEPCMYNQDWYLKEKFASTPLKSCWYLISKKVNKKGWWQNPKTIDKKFLPSAALATFTFFAYYLLNKEILWKNNFIWCKDKDSNKDQIYVGRYVDSKKINKNGFNIHRHLKINKTYGVAPSLPF